jgi:putative two-component system response regulator
VHCAADVLDADCIYPPVRVPFVTGVAFAKLMHDFDINNTIRPDVDAGINAKARDEETSQHMRRVGILSALLALSLGRPWGEVDLIRLAAPLHDIGKIAVPDYILRKPGKLTRAEFDQMKTHTFIGHQILGAGPSDVLRVAAQIALSHHERWDGTGYPQGLGGIHIPFPARITAIADVFDALTHARPYKEAWSLEEALETIEEESGRQFDPELVPAFLSLIRPRGLWTLTDGICK